MENCGQVCGEAALKSGDLSAPCKALVANMYQQIGESLSLLSHTNSPKEAFAILTDNLYAATCGFCKKAGARLGCQPEIVLQNQNHHSDLCTARGQVCGEAALKSGDLSAPCQAPKP